MKVTITVEMEVEVEFEYQAPERGEREHGTGLLLSPDVPATLEFVAAHFADSMEPVNLNEKELAQAEEKAWEQLQP